MGRLEGKRAIVTGAGSGIGRASAVLFAREGARCSRSTAAARRWRRRSRRSPLPAAVRWRCPPTPASRADVQAYVARAVAEFGGIDVLYANAGISGGDVSLFEQSVELWQEVLRVNLIGPFLAIKHAAPLMIGQGRGSIVCTASVAGLRANAGGTPYSASKAGVISLVQTSANSLAGTGVRVNAICPGLIETGMTEPIFEMARARGTEDRIGQLNPLERYGLPNEIAAAALFLASDDASYVNGQAIAVDGGLSSTLPFKRRRK